MAWLPGIALPPCSLGRCSATKIRDPFHCRTRSNFSACLRSLLLPLPAASCGSVTATFRSLARTLLLLYLSACDFLYSHNPFRGIALHPWEVALAPARRPFSYGFTFRPLHVGSSFRLVVIPVCFPLYLRAFPLFWGTSEGFSLCFPAWLLYWGSFLICWKGHDAAASILEEQVGRDFFL